MANKAHELWKKQMAEQGQATLEEIGIDFSDAVELDKDWYGRVMKQRYSGPNLQAAFDLGLKSQGAENPQELFEEFVEKLVGIKRMNKVKRQDAKARKALRK